MGISYYYDNIYRISKEQVKLLETYYNKSMTHISSKEIENFLLKKEK